MISALLILVLLSVSIYAIRRYIYSINYVPSGSMEPTVKVGDFVLARHYGMQDVVSLGTIVTLRDSASGQRLLKRVTGIPGQMSSDGRYLLRHDQYFVEGDNTANSLDSRFFGPISRSQIDGIAIRVLCNRHIADRESIALENA